MASREDQEGYVGNMNEKIGEYFDYVGVSEATKGELLRKANGMKEMAAFTSRSFHHMTIRLHTILQEAVMLCQFGNPKADGMNQFIYEYLGSLGVSEVAKTEFASKANAMKGLMGAFNSPRFRNIIHSLHGIVAAIRRCQVANPATRHDFDVDLNETPPVSVCKLPLHGSMHLNVMIIDGPAEQRIHVSEAHETNAENGKADAARAVRRSKRVRRSTWKVRENEGI